MNKRSRGCLEYLLLSAPSTCFGSCIETQLNATSRQREVRSSTSRLLLAEKTVFALSVFLLDANMQARGNGLL